MIQTILIVLVAVVVLIVIIAVLALRYLRSGDTDTFDDAPEVPLPERRLPSREAGIPAAADRRPRAAEPATDVFAAERPARRPEARVPAGYRDPDTGPRPAVADRGASGSRRVPAGARPAPGRPRGAEDTGSWDALSDVDYWTELAADNAAARRADSGQTERIDLRADPRLADSRPLPPALPSRAQSGPLARPQTGPIPRVQTGPAPRPQTGPIPRVQTGPAPRPQTGPIPRVQSGPLGRPQTGPAEPPPALPSRQDSGPGRRRPPADDPLTSPSLPAPAAAASRPYRPRRAAGSPPAASPDPGLPVRSAPPPAPRPYADYSAPDPGPGAAGTAASAAPAMPPVPADPAGPPVPAVSPAAANPYGSFVGPNPAGPGAAEPAYQPASAPEDRGARYRDDSAAIPAAAGYRGQRRAPTSTDDGYQGTSTGGSGRAGRSRGGRHRGGSSGSADSGDTTRSYPAPGYGDSGDAAPGYADQGRDTGRDAEDGYYGYGYRASGR